MYNNITGPELAGRLKDVRISVSSTESSSAEEEAECGYFEGVLNVNHTLIRCHPPREARFVRMQIKRSGRVILHIYEVEVHGIDERH